MWKMHQFTLAKHTPPKPYTRTAFVAGRAVRLATDLKTAPVNGYSIRPCFSAQRAASNPPVGDKRLVQLHNRPPQGSQAVWRHSRLRNVVDDQREEVEHKHTYIHVPTLWARDQWRPFRRSCGRIKTSELSDGCLIQALV